MEKTIKTIRPLVKKYRIFDIEWDTDGEECDLPQETEQSFNVYGCSKADISEIIGNYLSAEYGFCHKGFRFEEVKTPKRKRTYNVRLMFTGETQVQATSPIDAIRVAREQYGNLNVYREDENHKIIVDLRFVPREPAMIGIA